MKKGLEGRYNWVDEEVILGMAGLRNEELITGLGRELVLCLRR